MAKKIFCGILVLALLLSLTGCLKREEPNPTINTQLPGRTVDFSYAPTQSESVGLSSQAAEAVLAAVRQQQADYPYAHLYQMEEVKSRLDFDASVESHSYYALDDNGQLTGAHLFSLVSANNEAYLAEHTFGYKIVEADYLQQLCDFLVLVVTRMQSDYPQLDWQRIWCNLGNLKILYRTGMLSFAEVSSEMVLSISKNNTNIVLTLKGKNGFSQVLVHETIHILQMGCSCEQVENASRRAGISMFWNDFSLNTADWTWLVEGSAERHMCNLTGGPAVSYQYKMDYICSFTMAILLRQDVDADTMENLCFYDDPELLFQAFGCQSQQERDELLRLMITIQILQMQPKEFYEIYSQEYGVDMSEQEAQDQLNYGLKPAACITLAQEFYENLVAYLVENEMPLNDLFCLIRLFEGHINQHLSYASESKAQINAPFLQAGLAMRNVLLDALSEQTGQDMAAAFAVYQPSQDGNSLNAEFAALPQDKREFLLERAQWQKEQNALATPIPGGE